VNAVMLRMMVDSDLLPTLAHANARDHTVSFQFGVLICSFVVAWLGSKRMLLHQNPKKISLNRFVSDLPSLLFSDGACLATGRY
jgi:hypothetical protein